MSILLPVLMSCQSLYKAQKQMDKYNYAKAIDILKKASGNDKKRNVAIPMLAECYRMQHDIENAKEAYAKAVKLPDAKPETFYYYAKALQSTGDYEKAREMFQTYTIKNPSDPKGPLNVSYCDSVLGPWKKIETKFEVRAVNNINTKESEFGPSIYNGDLIYASDFSNNPAEGKKYGWTGRGYLNIMKSSPESKGDFWGNMSVPSQFDTKFNQEYHDGPAIFGDHGTDIWMCKREGSKRGKAVNLGSTVNTTENEMFPTITDDGTLYFSSEGHPGYGALDIFKTSNVNGIWSTPVNVLQPINSSYDDFAVALVPDSKSGLFSSNRKGGVGTDDIYVFRNIEPSLPAYITGLVKDKNTMQPIAGATVFLYNPLTGKVKAMKTGADGMYKTIVDKPADYVVKAMMSNFIADCSPFPLTEAKPGTTTNAPRDLFLDKLIINQTFKIDNIYYDFDKYNIRADAKPELDKLVQILKENNINVELGSHTDSRGTVKYNEKLSQNRAESVVKYIIASGIDSSRIEAHAYGEQQLINKCADGVNCAPAEHQANRRTEFKVTSINVTATDHFDPGKYNEGTEIELKLLPEGFFSKCK